MEHKYTVAALKELDGYPSFYSNMEEMPKKRLKFYRTEKGLENSIGNYHDIPYGIENICHVIPFREENNINTVKDVADYFTNLGWCPSISEAMLHVYGIGFDREKWEWYAAELDEDTPLTCIEPSSGINGGVTSSILGLRVKIKKKYEYAHLAHDDSVLKVFFKESSNVKTNLPEWLTVVNNYKYVPPKLDFLSLETENHELYFGMEIEVSSKITPAELQYIVTQLEPKQEPFFYHKHDGSISARPSFPNNFEIVTFPMTYRSLKREMTILFDKIRPLNNGEPIFSWGDDTGIHIHVNGNSFINKLHRNKFAALFNQSTTATTKFIERLGRRKFNAYCMPFEDHIGRTTAYKMKHGPYAPGHDLSRRAACRETNKTSEVRIFRGGFDLEHMKYCLEVVHAMHRYSEKTPLSIIGNWKFQRDFEGWLQTEPRYKRLKKELDLCA